MARTPRRSAPGDAFSTSSTAPAGWRERIDRALFAPVDGASLAIFRIATGLLLAAHVGTYLSLAKIEAYYTGPSVLFKYAGFAWVEPLGDRAMQALFALLVAAALAMAAGVAYRWATTGFFVGYLYVFLLDTARYNNHYYLILLLVALLAFVPADRVASLGRRRPVTGDGKAKGRWPAWAVPGWALWLIRFQVAVPYVFGGLAKLNPDWVLRAEPMSMWLRLGLTEGTLDLPFFREAWAGYAFAWSGLLLDLLVVPGLLWRRTRPWAFAAIAAFHLINSQLFTIGIFPWMMLALTTIFFEPDWPRRVRLLNRLPSDALRRLDGARRTVRPALTIAIAAWMAIQVILPFRHFAIPGWVDWTEEGSRYAWRMKLRHKDGAVRFAVIDPATRQTTIFEDFSGVLTKFQVRMMLHDPEMIRQFAVHLKARLEENGMASVEVRALTPVALNGRPPRPMIDPEIDLAAQPQAVWHADWIPPLDDRSLGAREVAASAR
ncbi:MAG: HTTM domain-containing protein [Acidobacteriota bacterium]